ncbi:MAG: hypothetical protein IJ354_05945 [Clostridia bacterium]|nr:hypothetical protein [Clostridia bacterium]
MNNFPGKKRNIVCFSEEFHRMLAEGELPFDCDEELLLKPIEPAEAEKPEPHDEPEQS